MDSLNELQELLRRLFRLDQPRDLDFGIHRVINRKRDHLDQYIKIELPEQVSGILEKSRNQVAEFKRTEFENAREWALRDLGPDGIDADGNLAESAYAKIPAGANFLRVQKDAIHLKSAEEMQEEIHSHLASFFARYECGGGDIVPQRRHSARNRYALPHNGEEVLLHWANRDQYYIKSAAYHPAIAFKADGKRFKFEIAEARDIPRDNNKDTGRFLIPEIKKAAPDQNGDIVIPFAFRALDKKEQKRLTEAANGENGNGGKVQRGILAEAMGDLKKAAAKKAALRPLLTANAGGDESAFMRHARRFVRRNTADFFIHRNLRKFLAEELDHYLKSEVLNADELIGLNGLAVSARMTVFCAVHEIAMDIVHQLAEWEDLQKALWEKKKFILQTDYCIAVGHIPNAEKSGILDDIAKCDKQWAEWKELGMHDELFSGKGKHEKRIAHLRSPESASLPIDTAHFPLEFKDRLLDSFTGEDNIPGIDDATDGVLIHGENWQALNLMQEMYHGRVKCVYIDPPYNTDASAILYKNDYKHSSWLSMMDGRLQLTPALMTADGILCAAIDDEEQPFLRILLSSIFSKELGVVPVRSNPVGRKTSGRFAPSHEYALFWGVSETAIPGSLPKNEKALSRYPFQDKDGKFAWLNLIRTGTGDKKEDSPTMYYPIYVGTDDGIRIPKMHWEADKNEWHILEKPRKGEVAVWPVEKNDEGSIDKRWQRGCERVASELDEYRVRRDANGAINIDFKTRMDEHSMPNTWWGDSKYAAAVQGTTLVKKILGDNKFDFPKSLHLVQDCLRASGLGETDFALDYFAGSGTTAHAVVNLNREDGGRRKFILAEAGEHFNTAILPRVKKVIYSPEWKGGKPSRKATAQEFERGPRLVKYQRIESYEDTLANIEFADPNEKVQGELELADRLAKIAPRYELEWESRGCATRLSESGLDSPFSYGLELTGDGGGNGENTRTESADLPETFAYLAGLRVRTRRIEMDGKRRYLVQRGLCGGRETAVIWRDTADWDQADYDRDAEFIKKSEMAKGADWILVNGDSSLRRAESLNPMFGDAMFPAEERE